MEIKYKNIKIFGPAVFKVEIPEVILKELNNYIDTYLYIAKNVQPQLLSYLDATEQAVNFYYTVENNRTGIKITFAIIYIIIVSMLLFLTIIFAITFAGRVTRPIINLITASENISTKHVSTLGGRGFSSFFCLSFVCSSTFVVDVLSTADTLYLVAQFLSP